MVLYSHFIREVIYFMKFVRGKSMEEEVRNGQIFIAYRGNKIKFEQIEQALSDRCPSDYVVKQRFSTDKFYAGKIIVDNSFSNGCDPYYNSDSGLLTVSGYNQNEVEEVCAKFPRFKIKNPDKYHQIIGELCISSETNMFQILSNYMHFCTVIWDSGEDSVIAGVTEPDDHQYTHLYYGYVLKGEIMFSNDAEILKQFCEEIIEFEPNTYMKDGVIYTFDGKKVCPSQKKKKENEKTELIKNTPQNADSFFGGLNSLLSQIASESIRSKIEEHIEEYFSSEKAKQKITNELDTEMKRQILEIVKKSIQEFSLENEITEKLHALFDEQLKNYTSQIQIPVSHIIKLSDTVLGQTEGSFYHEKFEQILTQVQLDEPIMLIGPAGSGKNVAISQVAQALGKHMYYTNNASNEFKLTGFIDAGGNYRDTEFYKAFKNGGLFFLDEIDNSDPSALIVINSAVANGYMAFPHETIDRHPDFRIIAAANTWGMGSDLQYVGRNALDAATLDRFDNIFFDYDQKLEKALYPNDEILEFMWSFRSAVYQSHISHVVSTRGIGKVYKKEINGIPVPHILTSNVIKNLGQDDINSIIGNMQDISSNNKFYTGIKELRLTR